MSLMASQWTALQAECERLAEEHRVAGVALALTYHDETFTHEYGVTNIDHPLPITRETVFQIGSISKTFTGLLGMMLVEEGLVTLDTPIIEYMPDFKVQDTEATGRVTLRDLLKHRAGWTGDWFPRISHGDDALAHYVSTMADNPQLTPVGETFAYNNAGFGVAGRLYEVVTGRSYFDLMREKIFEPLGMANATYHPWQVMHRRFAVGHDASKPNAIPLWSIGLSSASLGGLITTAEDLLIYARFWLENGITSKGERLLSEDGLKAMFDLAPVGGVPEQLGLSWFGHHLYGVPLYWHGGQTAGQTARLVMMPERDFSLAILTNSNQGSELTQHLTHWFLTNVVGLTRQPAIATEKAPDSLDEYVGEYEAVLSRVRVERDGDALVGRVASRGGFPEVGVPALSEDYSDAFPLHFFAPDGVFIPDGHDTRAEFLRDADGRIAWLRVGGRLLRPMR